MVSAIVLAYPARATASESGAPEPAKAADAAEQAPAAATSSSNASARDEAAQRFEAASALYAQGNYEAAAVELERAYALVPDPRVLYKLGMLRLHLQHHARARRAFERYLADGGAELTPDARLRLESDLRLLRDKTAELEVGVNVAGAEVLVDGVSMGYSPISAPLVVDVGEHHIAVRKDGYSAHDARLTLAGGEAQRVDVVLQPEVEEAVRTKATSIKPSRARPSPPAEQEATGHPKLTWVAWSVTGALAAGAASAGVLGLLAVNELDTLKDDPNASRAALERQAERAEIRLLTADVLTGATLLAAGGALYLTFFAQRETPDRSSHALTFRISPGTVTLAKRF